MSVLDTSRQKVVEIAQAILDGRMGIVAGSHQIRRLCGGHLGLDERDPDLVTFIGIATETDALPVGDVRQHWAPDSLQKKDLEIARCEAMYRAGSLKAAANLVARFTGET